MGNIFMKLDEKFIIANKLWDKGLSKEAFILFHDLAVKGDSGAQLNLGVMYEIGDGVDKDIHQAILWYEKAWNKDNIISASLNLADLYKKIGNLDGFSFWVNKAIESDDDEAKLMLAEFLIYQSTTDKNRVNKLLRDVINSENVTENSRDIAKSLLI